MIIAMTSTRGDQWILPLCLTTSLDWADRVVLSVHCPPGEEAYVEAVKQIVLDLPDHRWQRVDMMVVRDPIWSEMQHRQGMLERARNVFAQWKRPGDLLYTAIVDSDEVIYDPSGQMRQLAPRPGSIVAMPLYNLRGGWKYHSNGIWGDRIVSTLMADAPQLHYGGIGFHKREPVGSAKGAMTNEVRCLHFWGFSERRLRAKHALYKVVEHSRRLNTKDTIDGMYNMAIKGDVVRPASQWKFKDVPQEWLPDSLRAVVGGDEDIWQEREVASIIGEFGREYFDGLDLFGY